jgi:ATP-dependent DNA helicase RecQ
VADGTPEGSNAALVSSLKAWRRRAAAERGVPAFVVLHDSTLEEIARARPGDRAALRRVRGIGPAKVETYGDDVLRVVAEAIQSRSSP